MNNSIEGLGRALDLLGKTEESAVEYLRKKGIKGSRNSPSYCVLARFFTEELGERTLVDGEFLLQGNYLYQYTWERQEKLPLHLRKLIAGFDDYKYPDLVLEGASS